MDAVALRRLLHDQADRHDGVGHGQRVGVAQVDLVLAGGVLVLGVLDGDAHLLEREHAPLAEVARHVAGGQLEVRAAVEGHGSVAGVGVGEVEVLDLRRRVEREALLPGAVERPAQDVAGAPLERRPVEVEDVAEHPGHRSVVGVPGQDLEGLRIGPGQDVALLDPREPVDGRSVERHPLLEGVLELGGGDGERLGGTEHVREPKLDEADGPLLDHPEHVLLLAAHSTSAPGPGRPRRTPLPAQGPGPVGLANQCRRRRRALHAVHTPFTDGQCTGNRDMEGWRPVRVVCPRPADL